MPASATGMAQSFQFKIEIMHELDRDVGLCIYLAALDFGLDMALALLSREHAHRCHIDFAAFHSQFPDSG